MLVLNKHINSTTFAGIDIVQSFGFPGFIETQMKMNLDS